MKWQQEKQMKRKMDLAEQAKKKPFRVVHIDMEKFLFQNFVQPAKVCIHS